MRDKTCESTLAREIASICKLAWQSGLMRGFGGNASARLDSGEILITASGAAKGRLGENDFIVVDRAGKIISGCRKPSIELGLHLGLYAAFPDCAAILHTHPPYLQAVARLVAEPKTLDLGMAESDCWRSRLAFAPQLPPGSPELAAAVAASFAARFPAGIPLPCACWLAGHGLCAIATNQYSALGVSEELEHLAHIQWALLACAKG